MCGLCGELRFDGSLPDLAALARMSAQLARRGPDHAGSYSDGSLAFGHRRLSIIDLSPSANQPMVDAALQLALVFNGTIYNYRELRTELVELGYTFFSEGDSEVILKAYHAWGERCVERFYGMFAFAVWDQRVRQQFRIAQPSTAECAGPASARAAARLTIAGRQGSVSHRRQRPGRIQCTSYPAAPLGGRGGCAGSTQAICMRAERRRPRRERVVESIRRGL